MTALPGRGAPGAEECQGLGGKLAPVLSQPRELLPRHPGTAAPQEQAQRKLAPRDGVYPGDAPRVGCLVHTPDLRKHVFSG